MSRDQRVRDASGRFCSRSQLFSEAVVHAVQCDVRHNQIWQQPRQRQAGAAGHGIRPLTRLDNSSPIDTGTLAGYKQRYRGSDVVVWDADDLATDTHLRFGLSVARAICTRKAMERTSLDVDFTAIDTALLEIAKQVKELDEVRTWTDTIRSNGQKILDRLRISTEKLEKQGAVLTERVADSKEAMKKG